MSKIQNTVTYTVQSLYPLAMVEREAHILFRRKLTLAGALRILRKTLDIPAVAVIRIQASSI